MGVVVKSSFVDSTGPNHWCKQKIRNEEKWAINTTKNNVDYGEEERKINFLLSTVFLIEAPLIIMGLSIQTPIKWQSLGCWWRRYLFETKQKNVFDFFFFRGRLVSRGSPSCTYRSLVILYCDTGDGRKQIGFLFSYWLLLSFFLSDMVFWRLLLGEVYGAILWLVVPSSCRVKVLQRLIGNCWRVSWMPISFVERTERNWTSIAQPGPPCLWYYRRSAKRKSHGPQWCGRNRPI